MYQTLNATLNNTDPAVFERGACGDLTGWPPILGLLRYLIVLSTIYRVRMCLGLGHSASDVNMSMKNFSMSVLVAGMVKVVLMRLLATRGRSKRRADAEDVPQ